MIDTTKDTDITEARTPKQALEIARARISEALDDYARKADAAAWDGDTQMHEAHGSKTDGLEQAWMLMGDLLHEINEQGR